MYTAEEVDKKILEFRKNTKDQGLLLHNNYFIFTVGRDGNVCQEAYGANLMTDYGIRTFYVNDESFTGWENWNFRVKFGTGYDPANDKIPKLTNSTLYEFACKDNGYTASNTTLESGYYNDGTTMGTGNGVFYQTTRFQYAQLDYIINLTAQTSVDPGHIGGSSSASPRDTRWKTDENGDDYFEINEIGLTNHDNPNGSNLYFHFAILDKDGNPTPIRKYDNQKLYIYIYHTGIVSEKMVLDAWDRKEYITIEPINRTYSRYVGSRQLYCYLRSVEWDTVQWTAGENPIYYRANTSHHSQTYINYVSKPTVSFDADTHTVTETFDVPARLIERNDVYLSGFLLTNGGYDIKGDSRGIYSNYGSQWLNIATYDRQSTPEMIIAENFYTNDFTTLRFDDQIGSGHHNNGRKTKLLPIDKINSVQSIKMFNIQDNDYTIDEEFQSMRNYFNQRYLNIRSKIYNIKCPDNEKRNVWYYPNIFASAYGGRSAGFASNMNIVKFTNTGITLFACDNPFDISTWTQIEDITNPPSELVKKRYFVTYNDVTLTFEFQESQYPAIIPKQPMTLIDDGTNFRLSSFDVHIKPMYNNKHDILSLGDKLSYLNPTTHQHIKSYILNSPYFRASSSYDKYDSQYTGYPFSLYHTNGTYDDWFWFKTNENGVHLLHIPSFTNDEIEMTLFAKTETSSTIHVSTNDANIVSIENPSAPYGFYTIDLNKTPAQLGIVNNDSYDPTDIVATSYNVNKNKKWYTQSFITRPAADKSICPIIVWNNGKKSMAFKVHEYNENDELLYTSDWTKYDYQFHSDETVKYKLDFIWNYQNKSSTDGDYSENYNTYNGVKILRIVEHPIPKYDIEGARHITCVRGTNKICFTYASTDYLTKWYVVDATDLYDSNNNLKILNTFEIDESFAKAYKGSIGFAHYVYIRLTNSSNVNGTYLFDLETNEPTYLVDWDYDWELSTGEKNTQFYGDNRCIVFGHNRLSNSAHTYGDYSDGYKKIYCISADQPKTILNITSKIYSDNDDYNRTTNGAMHFNGFSIGYVNDGKQLILSTYGYVPYDSWSGNVGEIFTIDLGEFIKKRGHTSCAPANRYHIGAQRSTDAYFFFAVPAKYGMIRYTNGYSYAGTKTKLWFCPIESYVPHKIELTTDCITSYNQPIQFSNKEFQIKTTNDMTQFKLENSGKHPKRTD